MLESHREDRDGCLEAKGVSINFHLVRICQNSVLKGKILSKRSEKSVNKFRDSEWSAPKSNLSGSGKPIVEGVGLKVQSAEMQAVPFR